MTTQAELAAAALEMLTEFGSEVFIRYTPPASTNPAAGTVTPGTPVLISSQAIVRDINEYNKPGSASIEDGDQLAICSDELTAQCELVVGDYVWKVIQVNPIRPNIGDVGVVWFAHLRGAIEETVDTANALNSVGDTFYTGMIVNNSSGVPFKVV
jgi:hypothetical protein